jgi:hypothetical protein
LGWWRRRCCKRRLTNSWLPKRPPARPPNRDLPRSRARALRDAPDPTAPAPNPSPVAGMGHLPTVRILLTRATNESA